MYRTTFFSFVVVGCILSFLFLFPTTARAVTFTVTNTTDASDTSAGDGVCTTGVAGQCSLRAAIQEANALAGADIIGFNIPKTDAGYRDFESPNTASSGDNADGDDYWTIRPAAGFPTITSQVAIDGTTQATSQGDTNTYGPEIELKGTNTAGTQTGANGFYIYTGAANTLIKGFVVNAFNDAFNIHLVTDITIQGCYMGTNVKGSAAIANYNGVRFRGSIQNLTIGGVNPGDGNLASGNTYQGIGSEVGVGASGSRDVYILGNYIGTDRTGLVAVPNVHHGIALATQVYNVHIGDGTAAGRNVIAGSLDDNILIRHNCHDIDIRGNYLGLGADGTTHLSYTSINIWLFEAIYNITIGGTNPGDRNYIAGVRTYAIEINADYGVYNTTIINNYIGTDINGNIKSNPIVYAPNPITHVAQPTVYGTSVLIYGADGMTTAGHDIVVGQVGYGNLIKGVYGVISSLNNIATVEGNTIADSQWGVAFRGTENFATAPGNGNDSTDGAIKNNFIGSSASQPGGVDPNFGLVVGPNLIGVEIDGSSPLVTGNKIVGNTNYGIINQVWNKDLIRVSSFYRSNDSSLYLARPIIGGSGQKNTISGNGWGGIFSVDTVPANEATLYADNDFSGGNNNQNNIEQAWYGLFELFTGTVRRTDLTANTVALTLPTNTITRSTDDPASAISTTSLNKSDYCVGGFDPITDEYVTGCDAGGTTTGTSGYTMVAYPSGAPNYPISNGNYWFRMLEYAYDTNGVKNNYGTYKFDQNHYSSKQFSFDGNSTTDPATGYASHSVNSITYTDRGEPWTNNPTATRDIATGSIGRYQIMDVDKVDANPVWDGNQYTITVDSLTNEDNVSTCGSDDGAGAYSGGGCGGVDGLPNDKTSLREAVYVAKSFAQPVTIKFDSSLVTFKPTQAIVLSSPNTSNNVIIDGAGVTFDGSALPSGTSCIEINGGYGIAIQDLNFTGCKGNGVKVTSGSRIQVKRSSISSDSIPIDLVGGNEDANHVTANDFDDIDTGPNDLLNYPQIDSVAYLTGGQYKITGSLDYAKAEGPISIEIFTSNENGSGHGGSLHYLGAATVQADGSWEATVNNVYGNNGTAKTIYTATATNAIGDTSEFSSNYSIGGPINAASSTPNPHCQLTPAGSPVLQKAVVQDKNSVLLTFDPPPGDYSHYFLEYGTSPDTYWYGSANIGAKPLTSFLVKSLTPGTTYYFRVGAANGCASGGWSNELSVVAGKITPFSKGSLSPALTNMSNRASTLLHDLSPFQNNQLGSISSSLPSVVQQGLAKMSFLRSVGQELAMRAEAMCRLGTSWFGQLVQMVRNR